MMIKLFPLSWDQAVGPQEVMLSTIQSDIRLRATRGQTFANFCLKTKAKIWPGLSYMCHIRLSYMCHLTVLCAIFDCLK